MSKITDLLDQVNELRAQVNKPPLKSWKASAEALRDMHDRLAQSIKNNNAAPTVTELPTMSPELKEAQKRETYIDKMVERMRKISKNETLPEEVQFPANEREFNAMQSSIDDSMKKVKARRAKPDSRAPGDHVPAPKNDKSGTFKLADLCREHKIDPKVARARMRKQARFDRDGQHNYPIGQRDAILEFLRSSKK